MPFPTEYSPQEYINKLVGNAPTSKSVQRAIEGYFSKTLNYWDSPEAFFNSCLGRQPHESTEQQALFDLLKGHLSLTGTYTQYSLQSLYYLLYTNNIALESLPFLSINRSTLIGMWPLNEASGNAVNKVSGGVAGVNTSVVYGNAGKIGLATGYNGTNSLTAFTGLTVPIDSISVGFMYRMDAATPDASDRIIDWQDASGLNGFGFVHNSTTVQKIQLLIANGAGTQASIVSDVTLVQGTWYFVAFTFTTNSAKLYINGVQQGVTDTSCAMTSAAATLTIGKRAVASTNWNQGSLQNLFINNSILTATQLNTMSKIMNLV